MRLGLWVILLGSMTTLGGGLYWIRPEQANKLSQSVNQTQVPALTALGSVGDTQGNARYMPPPKQTTDASIEEATHVEPLKPSLSASPDGSSELIPEDLDVDLPVIEVDSVSEREPRTVPFNLAVSTALASTDLATQASTPRIAVVPFRVLGKVPAWLRQDANQIIAEQFISAIDTDRYTLIERSQISKIVEEKYLQLSDLVESATVASQIGKLAGVRFLVIGSLARLEWNYVLTARVVDCQGGGKIHGRGKITFRSIDQMPRKMDQLANLLGLRVGGIEMALGEPEGAEGPGELGGPGEPGAGVVERIGAERAWAMTDNQLINVTNPNATFSLDLQLLPSQREFVEGDKMSFVVRTTRRCFVTLLSIDPQGNVSVLFPNRWQQGRENLVEAGTSKEIPPTEAGFRFLASSPHGETLIKAIGTLRPLRFQSQAIKGPDQPLFQNLGNLKELNAKGLLAKADYSNAVGSNLPQGEGRKMLDALYSHTGWASTQLVIVTHRQKLVSSQPQPQQSAALSPVNSNFNANEQVFARWQQLSQSSRKRMPTESFTQAIPGALPGELPGARVLPASRELLVFYKPHANATTQGLGSGGGRVAVKTIHAQNTAKGIDQVSLQSQIDKIQASPDVQTVIPNYQFTLYNKGKSVPDTYYASVQWALRNEFKAGMDTAWHQVADRVRLIAPSLIAVVDQGCDVNDPRLAPALWVNPNEILNNGLDDDRNGQIDDIHGYNFVAKTSSLLSQGNKLHHGSFISSIIAGQVTGNSNDVIGLVPHAKILTAVAIGPDGTGDLNAILKAIDYAVRNGAKVINLSLGSPVSREDLIKLSALPLWNDLEKKNVILVCAAGNMNQDNDQTPVFPASLRRNNVITVMAIDPTGRLAHTRKKSGRWVPFSNYGRQSVHLAAPGSQILGIPARGKITISDGTSFAASMVVATVALVQGLHPDWDHQTVKRAVLESTRPLESLNGRCTTGGLLDVQGALDWKP